MADARNYEETIAAFGARLKDILNTWCHQENPLIPLPAELAELEMVG